MDELELSMATTLFLFGWYGVILVAGRLLASAEKIRLVWCPDILTFSWVKTAILKDAPTIPVVASCLLWPEYKGCEGHCIK